MTRPRPRRFAVGSASPWLTIRILQVLSKISLAEEEVAKAKQAREEELAKIVVKKEDVDFLVQELELDAAAADRALRENNNDVVAAARSFL